jgi:CelD/BcsL family acetyltransferase involved in cellulose biosynthesis
VGGRGILLFEDARPLRAGIALPSDVTTEIVSSVAGIRALTPQYQQLYKSAHNTLPFARQEWHLAWCEHFLNKNPRIDDEPLFCVVRNARSECVALIPFILSHRRIGPLRLGTVDLIGGDPSLTEIRNPMVQPGYERSTVAAVHETLSQLRAWDWVLWSGIGAELAAAMESEIVPAWNKLTHDYVLDLPPSWDEFRAGLKRNIRESLRHCYNSLRRDGHAFEFTVARAPHEIRPALERFLALHAARASSPLGPKHPNWFATAPLQTFLYDVCERLAAADAVRVFQLCLGGEVVAARIGFAIDDSIYLYYSGFDPAWSRYSVMTTLVAEIFRYAISQGVQTVNLSLTGEQSKLRWGPRLVVLHSAFVHREALRSRIACRAYQVALSGNGVSARLLKNLFAARRDWT